MAKKELTLLEKAKATAVISAPQTHGNPTERIDLSLAYARREITHGQCLAALGLKGNAITHLAVALMSAVRRGELEIIDKRKGAQ